MFVVPVGMLGRTLLMYILKRSMSCPSRTSIAGPYVPAVLWVRLSIVSLPSISTASFTSDRVRWRAGDGLCQFLYVRLAKRYVMFSSDRYWHWWTSLKKSWTYQLWIQPSIHERYLDSAFFFHTFLFRSERMFYFLKMSTSTCLND